jgi:hypothetical protein
MIPVAAREVIRFEAELASSRIKRLGHYYAMGEKRCEPMIQGCIDRIAQCSFSAEGLDGNTCCLCFLALMIR